MDHGEAHHRLWRTSARVERYAKLQGWIDDGERLALAAVADEARGRGVLDLGVGAGRTTWLLRLLTAEYVGLDWSPEMVASAKAAYRTADIRHGDARDLSELGTGRFALVLFSYNGIDNLGHADRRLVLDEVRRVLAPHGLFVYSTFSKLGSAYLDGPRLLPRRGPDEPLARFSLRSAYRAARALPSHRARAAAWRRAMANAEDHGEWALAPILALELELAHFTTVAHERRVLAEHGFTIEALITDDGRPLLDDGAGCSWFHVVARSESGEDHAHAPARPPRQAPG